MMDLLLVGVVGVVCPRTLTFAIGAFRKPRCFSKSSMLKLCHPLRSGVHTITSDVMKSQCGVLANGGAGEARSTSGRRSCLLIFFFFLLLLFLLLFSSHESTCVHFPE